MQRYQGVGAYGAVGLDFAVAVALGLGGGLWADKKLGWSPWLTIVGLLFGVAVGFNILFKAAKRMKRETEREERQQRDS
ncbi:MAG: F0F1-ATPase subunit [Sorangium cellulosum]|nr:MAG: F0F1-ATPase subunit [Sorangium cellulosum]